jgi:hypothetical protein
MRACWLLFISAFFWAISLSSGAVSNGNSQAMVAQMQSSTATVAPEILFFLVRGDSGEEMPVDADGDGITDEQDQCPGTLTGEMVDSEGCSQSQRDADADGVTDDVDQCPGTPADEPADSEGCSQSQLDDDADGVSNAVDECPSSSPGAAVNEVGCEDLSGQVRAVYESDVNPLIVSSAGGCTSSGCHGRFDAPGGLRLYSSSASNNVQLNYDALVSYIDRRGGNRLLGKISGTSGHGGGARFFTNSPAYQTIEDWVRSVEALP